MRSESTLAHDHPSGAPRSVTLVWIDAKEARIARWRDHAATVERLESDVPPHHRSSPHVRHDPTRHGGPGDPGEGGESRRLEHLAKFVRLVADRLPADDDLMVLGPGIVRDDLERIVRQDDRLHRRARTIVTGPADRLTQPQLIARTRTFAGDPPRRGVRSAARSLPVQRLTVSARRERAAAAAEWDETDDAV